MSLGFGRVQSQENGDERNSTSPAKTLRAEMGFPFHSTGCVTHAEACRNESHTININGSPRRAAETEEKPAGVNRPAHGSISI
jgi:hypothetical protein